MSVETGAAPGYLSGLFALVRLSLIQLIHSPSHSRSAEAARRLAWHSLLIGAGIGIAIVALMYLLDAAEIGLMPTRGDPALWLVRILTDLGKAGFVLWSLAGLLLVVVIAAPAMHGAARGAILTLAVRLQFLILAVVIPVIAGEIIKWAVGRGRPFVGGAANAFNFVPFTGTNAYASFPSSHSITAFALAFAVSAVWPRARAAMMVYAVLIAASRLVLLAHHPSDVVAGALVGVIGAMVVRYWFAARHLAFTIHRDGEIVPVRSFRGHLKRVARRPSGP
jgi:membrane-associated phospholipid phosphatase